MSIHFWRGYARGTAVVYAIGTVVAALTPAVPESFVAFMTVATVVSVVLLLLLERKR